MKFASYTNRDAILRLKCEKELSSMFKYVADRSNLIKDKEAMFGVFELDPSLLAIHPGLKPTFKRFIAKVENLVPKRKTATPSCTQKPPLKKARNRNMSEDASSQNDSKDSKKVVTVEDLINRFLKWLSKEMEKSGNKVSKEDQKKSFQIKAANGNDFKFMCLQKNCFEEIVLKSCKSNNTINMSSAHRHVTNSCWLSGKGDKKPVFRTSSSNNFFGGSTNNNMTIKGIHMQVESPMKDPVVSPLPTSTPSSSPLASIEKTGMSLVAIKKEKLEHSMMIERKSMETSGASGIQQENVVDKDESTIPVIDLLDVVPSKDESSASSSSSSSVSKNC